MTERDIERKAISEILKETELIKERNKPPENRFCFNKRLLSRNLVSTLRNPVFPKDLNKRRIIGLDDETEDESDTDDNRRKYSSSSKRHFADDDYIYDARDYFNPEKYREIVAYRSKKRQRQECYERKRISGYVGDSNYVPDVSKNNYHDDKLQYRELRDCANEEHEADVVDETARIKLLTMSSTSLCIVENTNSSGASNHRKRKHHKSKGTYTHSQQQTHRRKSKHQNDKLGCMQEDKNKKCGKCKKHATHCIKKARHKKKKTKKQKKSAYTSDIEFRELNQFEDFSKLSSDCLGNTSPYSGYFGNEDSSSSMQHSLCYNGNLSNHRLVEGDSSLKAEQSVNGFEVSYEGSALVSAKYLTELYFRTRHNSDNGESSIHLVD